jgi:hypothetical protein
MPATAGNFEAVGPTTLDLSFVQGIEAASAAPSSAAETFGLANWEGGDGQPELDGSARSNDGAPLPAASISEASQADPTTETSRGRVASYVTGRLGWLWGMFRAYGGTRDGNVRQTERDQMPRG